MCLIRMITGSIVAMLFGTAAMLLIVVLALGGLTLVLAANGGPSGCEPRGGPLTIDDAQAASFRDKWREFQDALEQGGGNVAGGPEEATQFVAFSESELSSRANQWADERHVPIEDIRVCLGDGYGEGTGRVSILGFDTNVRVKGTVEFAEGRAQPKIDEMEIGRVPGFMSGPLKRLVNRALDKGAVDIENKHDYRVLIGGGSGAVAATKGETR